MEKSRKRIIHFFGEKRILLEALKRAMKNLEIEFWASKLDLRPPFPSSQSPCPPLDFAGEGKRLLDLPHFVGCEEGGDRPPLHFLWVSANAKKNSADEMKNWQQENWPSQN